MLHADWYNVCTPDGSCGIQLALLYQCLDPVDWTAALALHDSRKPYSVITGEVSKVKIAGNFSHLYSRSLFSALLLGPNSARPWKHGIAASFTNPPRRPLQCTPTKKR